MKISLNWLTDYVDVSMSAKELAGLLTVIGLPVEEIIQTDTDIVLDVEVTSNRSDCLGHIGVAREVAAATGAEFRLPRIDPLATSGKAAELTGVQVLDPDLCPRYTARVIRGVKVGPSPAWMVDRLQSIGLRSINNVVDVTNYVMMEYSQPLHSFDYDKLLERRIVVRRAAEGEMLVSIDGTGCHLDGQMLVIADAERPVAIAGVMGGLNTEVSDGTANVLLEAAQFDPLSVRRTSRKLMLLSESNYRFERGIDPVGLERASLRACQFIIQLAGGELAEGIVDVWTKAYVAPRVAMRPRRCDALLGLSIPPQRQMELLARLGLSPAMEDGKIACTIPSYRPDLTREADLIEEVARLEGYDRIPVGGAVTHVVGPEGLPQRTRRKLGEAMMVAGFDEAMTFSFIDKAEAELMGFADPVCADPLVRRTNNALRPTLLPSLLRACKSNQDAGNAEVSLYELAAVFPRGSGPSQLPDEYVQLGMVTTGDLRELRGALELLAQRVVPQGRLEIAEAAAAGVDPAVSAEVLLDGEKVGVIGQIASAVRDYYGLEHPIAAATVHFEALLAGADVQRKYQPLPKFPSVRRDLSLIVNEDVTWGQLSETIAAVDQPLRADVEYVTTYRGKPIPDGRKSVTATLVYRSTEGTLRSEQVDQQVQQIIETATKELNAEVRA